MSAMLKSEELLEYLTLQGWRLKQTEPVWYVLEKEIEGQSIPVYLPTEKNTHYASYLEAALQTISALSGASPASIAADIRNRQRDILRIRTHTEDTEGIPLSIAAEQIRQLKRLFAYGALAEASSKPQPYYLSTSQKAVQEILHKYQFGHTFRGSFGFIIRSPEYEQPSLFDGMPPPWERRTLKRIARGLQLTQQAVKEHATDILVEGYKEGFTAEMCEAFSVIGLRGEHQTTVTFNWASALPIADQELPTDFTLSHAHYEYLRDAAEKLKKQEPQETIIEKAFVIDVGVTDNPAKPQTSRSILLRWYDITQDQTHLARLSLSAKDYTKALKAQHDWLPVRVKGILVRKKGYWVFRSYSSFDVLNLFEET